MYSGVTNTPASTPTYIEVKIGQKSPLLFDKLECSYSQNHILDMLFKKECSTFSAKKNYEFQLLVI